MQNLKENNNLVFIRSPTAEACSLQSFAMMLQTMLLIPADQNILTIFQKLLLIKPGICFSDNCNNKNTQISIPSLVQIPRNTRKRTHAHLSMCNYFFQSYQSSIEERGYREEQGIMDQHMNIRCQMKSLKKNFDFDAFECHISNAILEKKLPP
jgi:hypothetical protein